MKLILLISLALLCTSVTAFSARHRHSSSDEQDELEQLRQLLDRDVLAQSHVETKSEYEQGYDDGFADALAELRQESDFDNTILSQTESNSHNVFDDLLDDDLVLQELLRQPVTE